MGRGRGEDGDERDQTTDGVEVGVRGIVRSRSGKRNRGYSNVLFRDGGTAGSRGRGGSMAV